MEIYFGDKAGLVQEYDVVNPILTLAGFTCLTVFNLTGTEWYKRKNGMWNLLLVQFFLVRGILRLIWIGVNVRWMWMNVALLLSKAYYLLLLKVFKSDKDDST